jgi:quercetin dioxygenase-like cupin family protein
MRPLKLLGDPVNQKQRGEKMKRTLWLVGLAAAMLGAWCIGRLQGQADANKVISAAADKANYTSTTKGVWMAPIWGDATVGAHATYTKFAAGYDAGLHTHTNDVWIVGIKGAYLYKDDAGEKRVGPGDFLRVPGGHKHWSGGDKKEGALFYEESSGKFDLIPAK